jgi:hypothetical protein
MAKHRGSIDALLSLSFGMGGGQGDLLALIAAAYFKLNIIWTANRASQTSLQRRVSNRSNGDGQIRPWYLSRLSLRKQQQKKNWQ